MRGRYHYAIRDLPKNLCRTIAYYFYILCLDIEDFKHLNYCLDLYNALVKALNLQNHSKQIIEAVINQHIKKHNLTIKDYKEDIKHPYSKNGKLEKYYKEDNAIHDNCGWWDSDTEDNINLIRAVFAGKQEWFLNIIEYTFFIKPDKRRKAFYIPTDFNIKKEVIENLKQPSYANFLVKKLRLEKIEGEILNIAYIYREVSELNRFFDNLINQEETSRLNIYAKCTSNPINIIRNHIQNDMNLSSYGLIDFPNGAITSTACNCIYDGNISSLFLGVFKNDQKDFYPLSSFTVKEDDIKIASRLLSSNKPMNILLYGAPGAGKTQFARSLIHSLKLTPLLFNNEIEMDNENYEQKAISRLNRMLSVHQNDSVIIVDEAEELLKTQSLWGFTLPQKGIVNKMLEESPNKVIWILNYTDELDESTKRRFTYSIKFNEINTTMLRNMAGIKLQKLNIGNSLQNEIVDLCGKYHVTGASIDNMVKILNGMDLSYKNRKQIINDVKKVLESNSKLIYGKKKMRDTVRDSYDLSILNTTFPAEEIINMVVNARKNEEEYSNNLNGIRMLFYGLSGTGKTEFARYIAEKLNKKIILKRPSDILSKWVGENEANIRRAFEQAEATDDILLFDEADTFFADRTNMDHSWERSTVNEFLTQMEEFSGILICTTNLRQIMDPAMQRRFHILTEFKPLDANGIEKLLKRYFKTFDFNQDLLNQITKYDTVTPGDFGQLAGKIRFMSKNYISSEMIVDELCKIQEEKEGNQKHIGFVS